MKIPVIDLSDLLVGPPPATSADVVFLVTRALVRVLGVDVSVTALPYLGAGLVLVHVSLGGSSETCAVELGAEPVTYASMAISAATYIARDAFACPRAS